VQSRREGIADGVSVRRSLSPGQESLNDVEMIGVPDQLVLLAVHGG